MNELIPIKSGDKVRLSTGEEVTIDRVEPYYFLCFEIKGYRLRGEIKEVIQT